MIKDEAKKTGSKYAFRSVCIGLVIAQVIMTFLPFTAEGGLLKRFLWFMDFDPILNVAIGVIAMMLGAHFFGQQAGIEILIKKKGYAWTGIKYGFIIFITASLIGSSVGFFREGLDHLGTND